MAGLVAGSFLPFSVEVDVVSGSLGVHWGSYPARISAVSCSLKFQLGESLETRFLELGWRDGLRVGVRKPVFEVDEELFGVCK